MASAFLKVLQDLRDSACTACGGTGKFPNEDTTCETCYGTGFMQGKVTNDRATCVTIVSDMLDKPSPQGIYPTSDCYARLEQEMVRVRAEAIGWTWSEACNQYDRGLDVRRTIIPELLERADADLNPIHNKEER